MLCECGCGRVTAIARKTDTKRGVVKGQPLRVATKGCAARLGGRTTKPDRIAIRDMGFQTPCHLWLLALDRDGYGSVQGGLAHREAYEREYGPIEAGMQLHHRCEVRHCVNPAHLELVADQRQHMVRHRSAPDAEIVAARAAGERPRVTCDRLGVSRTAYYRALGRAGLRVGVDVPALSPGPST